MSITPLLRVVIDTNVVFGGLTKQGGAAGLVIDSWLHGLLEVCVSNALAYEYDDVLSRKLSATRWHQLQPVLGSLLRIAQFTTIYYSWRPTSPDAGDDFVIDFGAIPEEGINLSKQSFQALLQQRLAASTTQIESALAQREMVEPEPELSPEIIARLQQRIRNSTQA